MENKAAPPTFLKPCIAIDTVYTKVGETVAIAIDAWNLNVDHAQQILPTLLDLMGKYGLFLCPLNNGDWMVGIGSKIYDVHISEDHYKDKYLSIADTPKQAIEKMIEKIEAGLYPGLKERINGKLQSP